MTSILLRPPSWTATAACTGMARPGWDPFDAEQAELLPIARATCATCPAVDACLDDALATGEAFMVRGGLTPAERADLARLRGAPAPARLGLPAHGEERTYAAGCHCAVCRRGHARRVTAWRRTRAARPATSAPRLIVVTFELTTPSGTGRRRAFPGQLALQIGDPS